MHTLLRLKGIASVKSITLVVLLLASLFLLTPQRVEATVNYSFSDYAYCNWDGARASSMFNWANANIWDWGQTNAGLWVWSTDSQSWVVMDSHWQICGGGSCRLLVTVGPKMTGSPHTWIETATSNQIQCSY
jgi:hypothetical protein